MRAQIAPTVRSVPARPSATALADEHDRLTCGLRVAYLALLGTRESGSSSEDDEAILTLLDDLVDRAEALSARARGPA